MVYATDHGEGFGWTQEPDSYDECAKVAAVLGMGAPWEGHRVLRSLIVGPVAYSVPRVSRETALSGFLRWNAARRGETADRVIRAEGEWSCPATSTSSPNSPGPGFLYEGWA